MKNFVFSILLLLVVVNSTFSRQLPSYINLCHQDLKNVSECVYNVINEIRPQLAEGIKDLGVPPMKRLEISELSFDVLSGNSNISTKYTDLVFSGAENFEIKSVFVDPVKGIFELAMLVPKFQCNAKYDMKGRLILLDLAATGDVQLNFTNVLIDSKFIAEPFTKNDKVHYKFKVKSFEVNIESFRSNFDNLINGNAEVTRSVNQSFNENSDLVLDQMKPVVRKAVQELVTSVLNRAFSRYPLDELYPK